MSLNIGDLVDVRIFGGQVVTRQIERIEGRIVVLTTSEEKQKAAKEQREPVCIGFPLSDILKAKKRRG